MYRFQQKKRKGRITRIVMSGRCFARWLTGLSLLIGAFVNVSTSLADSPIELVDLGFRQGRLALSYTEGQRTDIYLIDFDTQKISPLVESPGRDSNPRWSNDGKQLAFDSNRSGKSAIYIKSLVEPVDNERKLVALEGAQQPDWSPDDAYVVFSARNKSSSGRSLIIANVDDGEFRRLYKSSDSITTPRWSPRGTEILFSSNRSWPGWDVELLQINTSTIETLSKGVQNYVRATWHPHGGAILFSYGSAREFDLWKIEKGSMESKEVLDMPGREFDAEWILNGNVILFVAEDSPGSGKYEVFMYDLSSEQTQQLTKSRGSIRGISWSPFPLPPVRALPTPTEDVTQDEES